MCQCRYNRTYRVQRHAGGGQITDKYLRGVVVDEVINGYHYDWPNKEKNLTFHHDHLNSVTAVTGHNGTTVETAHWRGRQRAMRSQSSGKVRAQSQVSLLPAEVLRMQNDHKRRMPQLL